jgi:uncharacterized damage-inducible protein DinB
MRTGLVMAVTLIFCGAPASAQTPAGNPYVKAARGQFAVVQTLVMLSAEKVGEELYAFKPTPDVRTLGEVLGHIAGASTFLCSVAAGTQNVADVLKNPAALQAEEKKASKADVIAALKKSRAYCESVFDSLADARAQETVPFLSPDSLTVDSITLTPTPKLMVLTSATSHAWEHYGNLVTYMRLKGIVPPSSERKSQ